MFTKLASLSLVVSVLSIVGCGDIPGADEASADLGLHDRCGFHVGHYSYELGARVDGATGCEFSPSHGDLVLPQDHAGTACTTSSATDYGPNGISVEDASGPLPGTLFSDAMTCHWSRNGDVGTCVLSEVGSVDGVACASRISVIYKRVEAVIW